MKRQLIALMMAIVMVASICAVAATTVSAATPTSFSIAGSTNLPAVGEKFTITGKLTVTASYAALTYKPVHLESHKKNSDGTWTAWANLADTTTMKTDSAGKVSSIRTLTTPGAREYRWHFPATSTYAAAYSSAKPVTAKFKTVVNLYAQYYKTNMGDSNRIDGDAQWFDTTQNKWLPLAGKTIVVVHDTTFTDGKSLRFTDPSVTTGPDGKFSFTAKMGTEPTKRQFFATYAGSSTEKGSTGSTNWITAKWQPLISEVSARHEYYNGDGYTETYHAMSGYLRDHQGNPMPNKYVGYYYKNSYTNGQWKAIVAKLTDDVPHAGFFYFRSSGAGMYDGYYKVMFGGDDRYWPVQTQEYRL